MYFEPTQEVGFLYLSLGGEQY
ncbi:hypothetical protein VIBNISOn1_270029 [Vibrio nigripulchritudo SOn1]|uniref:Uncharacterized protein n=1 Tax=Vibrio nigripulchritudo SOn1 TaxID=1238450 RepID=A0AAV2VS09_9VIBR|nr:hypothetical protein VIBNISOn1_270029 [Vibrio nigripulchritudo SOn1]